MKKVLLTLGLVAGMVANAQMAIISGSNHKVYRVTRLNFDSVEVKHLEMGNVKSTDTMTVGDFTTLTGGYSIMSGNITNPKPVAPKISKHDHTHDHTHKHPTFKSELKDYWKRANTPGTSDYTILWGGIGFGIGYMIFKWITPEPTKFNNIPSGGGIYPIGGGQCTAIAASTNRRCLHRAQPGRNRCWQH